MIEYDDLELEEPKTIPVYFYRPLCAGCGEKITLDRGFFASGEGYYHWPCLYVQRGIKRQEPDFADVILWDQP